MHLLKVYLSKALGKICNAFPTVMLRNMVDDVSLQALGKGTDVARYLANDLSIAALLPNFSWSCS